MKYERPAARSIQEQLPDVFCVIGFGCQKVALKFLIGKLHKAVPILFRCPKIRKSKSACVKFSQSDMYVLNVPSMGH